MIWFREQLPTRGWAFDSNARRGQLWRKGDEQLELRTGRRDRVDTIRIRLTKAPLRQHPNKLCA